MRIAFVTWRDTDHPDGGGSEVYVEQIGRELARRGHRVTVVCAHYPGAAAVTTQHGVVYRRLGGRLGVYPRALLWVLRHRRRLDVVVDVVNGLPFWTPWVRRRGVVALVHHVHREQWHIIYPRFWGAVGWFIEGRLVPRVYSRVPFLTVSEASRADLVRLGVRREEVTVARNGLAATPSAAARSTGPRLVVLGRLVPHKRFDQALRLVAALREELPDLHLDVVGEGWWGQPLREEAARLGLGERVTFHGRVTDQERDDLLATAWLAVLPSVKEGWGLAIAEAAAQGTPAVAYRSAGGVTEAIVEGETGWLVDDEAGLVRVVGQALSDPHELQRRGELARARSRAFSWSATADVVESILERAR